MGGMTHHAFSQIRHCLGTSRILGLIRPRLGPSFAKHSHGDILVVRPTFSKVVHSTGSAKKNNIRESIVLTPRVHLFLEEAVIVKFGVATDNQIDDPPILIEVFSSEGLNDLRSRQRLSAHA